MGGQVPPPIRESQLITLITTIIAIKQSVIVEVQEIDIYVGLITLQNINQNDMNDI